MSELVPIDQVQQAVATQQPPKKRAILSDAIKSCIKIVKAQKQSRDKTLGYLEALFDNERKLGSQLAEIPRKPGPGRGKKNAETQQSFLKTIASAGIPRDRADRAQCMAKPTEDEYRTWLSAFKEDGEDIALPTLDGLYRLGKGGPPIAENTGETEWFTPPCYIESARKVMGSIFLDPASCDEANETVQADYYYTPELNGLAHEWAGPLWLNPPFSMLLEFAEKLIAEIEWVEQAIFLGPNYSDSKWWQLLAGYAYEICHTDHRIRFLTGDGKISEDSPTNGHTFFYFGEGKFEDEFMQWGVIR